MIFPFCWFTWGVEIKCSTWNTSVKMKEKKPVLKVKDHSVSGEQFELLHNERYDMLETYPQPAGDQLPRYYLSEDYISHTDSKKSLFEKVYHLVKAYSLKQKLKLIEQHSFSGKTLLDVGCGTGDLLKLALNSGWEIQGIEPNEKARSLANEKTGNRVLDSKAITDFPDASFSVITLWHVLEHLPNLEQQLKTLNRLLKDKGMLIIAVPNFKSHDAKHYQEFWAAYDAPRHLWHFSQTSIKKLFSEVGMVVSETRPMPFDSFYVSLLSEKYRTGRMQLFSAAYRGLLSNLKARRSGEWSSLIYVLKKNQNAK